MVAANEKEIVLPELAESVVEGEILEWRVAEGETVERDQPLLEVSTDKVTVELPSPHAGVLVRQLVKVGDTVAVHAPIAVIREGGEGPVDSDAGADESADEDAAPADTPARESDSDSERPAAQEEDDGSRLSLFKPDTESQSVKNPFSHGIDRRGQAQEAGAEDADAATEEAPAVQARAGSNRYGRTLAVPSARILARELGVDVAEVPGSGPNGRVRREDVRAFAEGASSATTTAAAGQPGADEGAQASVPPGALPPPVAYHTPSGYADREQREPLRGVRKAIARQMSASHLYAVRTLAVDEADLSRLVEVRARLKARAEQEGVRLSYLPFVFKALVWALMEYPDLNTSLDEATQEIVRKTYYNIGLAVATEAGLVVPVVCDAERKSILDLGREINAVAERAREGKLAPEDMRGASFSVTNIGSVGTLFSFPIINSPDAAILGVHAIKERPVAVDGQVAIRPMMYLSLSFDHRLVDGATAARFLKDIITRLESPDEWLLAAV